jgi:hypothetical protein
LKKVKKSKIYKEIANELDTDEFIDEWEEMGHFSSKPYYDAPYEHCSFIIGAELTDLSAEEVEDWDSKPEIARIKKECKALGLDFKKPEMLHLVDVQ